MKVDITSQNPIVSSVALSEISPNSQESGGDIFKEILGSIESRDIAGVKQHQDLTRMGDRLISGASITPRELLLYQIRAGEFGLKVEMISKMSESAVATVRKLQQTQG